MMMKALILLATLHSAAAQTTVHQIAAGECRELAVPTLVVPIVTREMTGVTRGDCNKAGFTVSLGATTMMLPIPSMSIGGVDYSTQPIAVGIFAPTGTVICGAHQMSALTATCSRFDSMDAAGICGSACERTASRLISSDSDCVVPSEVRTMLDTVSSTCAGDVAVDPTLVTDAATVGLNGRCAVGFCEDASRCPQCSAGLTCQVGANTACAGTCYGSCQAPDDAACQTCGELGWIGDTCGEGGECHGAQEGTSLPNVCGESDASGLVCTNAVTHAAANDLCMGIGARLCTAEELWDYGESSGTGCMHDSRLVWSSSNTLASLSLNCGDYEKVVVTGGVYNAGRPGLAPQCMNVGSAGAALRCCADTVCNRPDSTLETVAGGIRDISTLVGLVNSMNLGEVLSTPGPWTIFAPSNSAFNGAAGTRFRAQPAAAQRDQLKYHIVSGEVVRKHSPRTTQHNLITMESSERLIAIAAGGSPDQPC
jgi:hypothetical protein